LARFFVKPDSGACRTTWNLTTHSTFRVPVQEPIPCTAERRIRFADVRPTACAVRLRRLLACAAEAGCRAGMLSKLPHNRIPVEGRPRRPVPAVRSRFCAFFTPFPAKTHRSSLVIPVKPPNPAAISPKRGKKVPILGLHRNPQSTPRLWSHLAMIARLG
jgi:hypothetical protein